MSVASRIQEQLTASRERLLEAIEDLPDEALLEPGAVGEWSVADLLAILTAWEAEVVTGLMRVDGNKRPTRLLAALARPEPYERQRYREYRGRDLDQIFGDWQHVRRQLEEWLEYFSNRDLSDKARFPWLDGRSLQQVILLASHDKEAAYVAPVREFSRSWLARQAADPGQVIPLSAVSAEQDHEE